MSDFTRTSPTSAGLVSENITEIGGVVLDMIGLNGSRLTSQLAASTLFEGFFDGGSPFDFNGNPGTIGVQAGFTPDLIAGLGGGIAELAVRITVDDGDTAVGNFDEFDNELLVNGVVIDDFTNVATQQTSADGETVFVDEFGFQDEELSTGWFLLTDPVRLEQIFDSLASGQVSFQLSDIDPFDNFFDFTQGIDGGIIDVGADLNFDPVAGDDVFTGAEDGVLVGDVSINDSDGDNDPLTYTLLTLPTQGAFGFNPDGTFTYELPADEFGTDSFTYSVSDGIATDTATVTLNILPVNDLPVFQPPSDFTIVENLTEIGTLTATDIDVGDVLSYGIGAGGDGALFAIDAVTGALSFLSAPDFEQPLDGGADNVYDLTVEVFDGTDTVSQAVTVEVLNDPDDDQQNTNPTIFGDAGNNRLVGTDDDDVFDGLEGRDVYVGLAGSDTFVLGDGDGDQVRSLDISDVFDVSAWGVQSFDELKLSDRGSLLTISDQKSGNVAYAFDKTGNDPAASELTADNFVFAAVQDLTVIDQQARAAEQIMGRAGDDMIFTGAGINNVFGQGGADTFVIAESRGSILRDYMDNEDMIDVSAWGAQGIGDLDISQDAEFVFVGSGGPNANLLRIDRALTGLDQADLTEDDFIFDDPLLA